MRQTTDSTRRDVVIVGGGPTGVAAFRALAAQGGVDSITILDPIPIGFGNVFGERCAGDPILLCNSSNGLTWIDSENHDDFLNFLVERGWPVGRDDHVPRFLIGEYCRQRYLEFSRKAEAAGIRVEHIQERAVAIHRFEHVYDVALGNGRRLAASHVLLCTGMEVPKIPPILRDHADNPRFLPGAFPARDLRELLPGSRVLVIGLRSSAQDAMIVLVRAGHSVTMTSPSGRFSAIRDVFRKPEQRVIEREKFRELDPISPDFVASVTALVQEALAKASAGLSFDRQSTREIDPIRRLRAEFALTTEGRTRWADLLFDVINTINDVVSPWDADTRARLLPKAYSVLTRYISSLPHYSGQRLIQEIDAGKVSVSPVYLDSVAADDDGWLVVWANGRTERFDYIVSTSGYHFPRFYLQDRDTLLISHAGARAGEETADIDGDLRLHFGAAEPPERIWALGAATNQRFPFAHLLWLAAQHARHVAAQVVEERANGVLEFPNATGRKAGS
jgi:uncharacterized NAD(P)/FAD-binding protein YdhS